MLLVRVDIGIVPQGTDLVSVLPPVFHGIGGAVSAAAVNQD